MDDMTPLPKPPAAHAFAAKDPVDCQSMLEVRAGVDEIDRLLVALIARRQGYMDAAARIKPSRSVVRDEARIQQVLDNVRAAAGPVGLQWSIAEPVWRAMMEACIAYEFDVWDRTRAD
jgi:isochorismate pyruvate lyase